MHDEKNLALLEVKNISKSFKKNINNNLLVLNNISFTINENEIIAILGKSGSGKSTLLRIIAGLVKPSSGDIYFKNKLITNPNPDIAMVFQSFALLPWLTVLGNVELGLEAIGLPKNICKQRALKAIDTIGLDGFESAYPKELSGGMRQRVGLARALVVEPSLLLLDEAFSALDVLTAENLRTDIMDLWQEKQTKTKGILLVTHSIEEAVLMADKILIFDSDPGKIKYELTVNISQPRNNQDPKVLQLIDTIYMHMTEQRKKTLRNLTEITINYRLPDTDIDELTGLIEAISLPEQGENTELPELADDLHLDIDDLFPILEILEILKFVQITKGSAIPTNSGKNFAEADILEKKQIFAYHLVTYVPLAKYIKICLDKDPNHVIEEKIILEKLEEFFSEPEAAKILKTVINWGRYAEIFAYDYKNGELSLENPE